MTWWIRMAEVQENSLRVPPDSLSMSLIAWVYFSGISLWKIHFLLKAQIRSDWISNQCGSDQKQTHHHGCHHHYHHCHCAVVISSSVSSVFSQISTFQSELGNICYNFQKELDSFWKCFALGLDTYSRFILLQHQPEEAKTIIRDQSHSFS